MSEQSVRGATATSTWRAARVLGGAAILVALGWRVGAGPFLDGLRMVDARSLALAAAVTGLTTLCCAWRWSIVAHGLGVGLGLRPAVAAYYRSQFLNVTLPGGVLGDVHRAVTHGQDVGDVRRGVSAVALERSAGQVVQATIAVLVLVLLPSPVRPAFPAIGLALVAGAVLVLLVGRAARTSGSRVGTRTAAALTSAVRRGLLARSAWPGILLACTVVVVGHTFIFVIAARTAGSTAPVITLLPLALLVLLAMSLPLNVAGWGPREGVAAWAFAAAGLGGAQGIATAVVYGVMVLVASLPGAVVLVVVWLRHRRPPRAAASIALTRDPELVGPIGSPRA